MKKKIVTLSLAVALIAILVGGSLAYFMDQDEVTNVFIIGSVDIVQNEEFEQKSQLMPIVPDGTTETPVDDANFVDKVVTVENVGKNAAYVQTFVAVPKALDDAGALHVYHNETDYGWNEPVFVGTVTEDKIDATNGDENLVYNVYKYVYKTELAVDATTDAVISGVYIDKDADLNPYDTDKDGKADYAYLVMNEKEITEFDALKELNVYVATQAIQNRGFSSATDALGQFKTHPWATE